MPHGHWKTLTFAAAYTSMRGLDARERTRASKCQFVSRNIAHGIRIWRIA